MQTFKEYQYQLTCTDPEKYDWDAPIVEGSEEWLDAIEGENIQEVQKGSISAFGLAFSAILLEKKNFGLERSAEIKKSRWKKLCYFQYVFMNISQRSELVLIRSIPGIFQNPASLKNILVRFPTKTFFEKVQK